MSAVGAALKPIGTETCAARSGLDASPTLNRGLTPAAINCRSFGPANENSTVGNQPLDTLFSPDTDQERHKVPFGILSVSIAISYVHNRPQHLVRVTWAWAKADPHLFSGDICESQPEYRVSRQKLSCSQVGLRSIYVSLSRRVRK